MPEIMEAKGRKASHFHGFIKPRSKDPRVMGEDLVSRIRHGGNFQLTQDPLYCGIQRNPVRFPRLGFLNCNDPLTPFEMFPFQAKEFTLFQSGIQGHNHDRSIFFRQTINQNLFLR